MGIKRMISRQPTHFKLDKKGNRIPVYRAGILDTNKYAKKGRKEKHDESQIGKAEYEPLPDREGEGAKS